MDIPALLYHGVERNDVTTVQRLLADGANPNESYSDVVNISTRSILHVCCRKGSKECAQLLVEAGADVLSTDKYKMTPVVYAIIPQHFQVVDYLLSVCKEAVEYADRNNKAPLHFAVESDCVETVRVVLNHGGNVNQRSFHGITPLMSAIYTPGLDNREAITDILITTGADLELKDQSGRAALQYAVMKRNTRLVENLLMAGADPNTTDATGYTPITSLIRDHVRLMTHNRDIDDVVQIIISILVQYGAELDVSDSDKNSPLFLATSLKADNFVRLMLHLGADPNIKMSSGSTPLLVSVVNRDLPCAQKLLSYGGHSDIRGIVETSSGSLKNINPMELAIQTELWDFVREFISYGYDMSTHRYLFSEHNLPTSLHKNPDMLCLLRHCASSPPSLFNIVVNSVKRHFRRNLHRHIQLLPIPSSIKHFILFN